MDIGLLGALDVRENGVSVTPSAPKPRQVLALLALHVDQVVPLSVLVEELWGDAPPRSARTTLQTYVLQLRELIAAALCREPVGEGGVAGAVGAGVAGGSGVGGGVPVAVGGGRVRGAKDVLVTSPGGYVLVGGGGACDVREFERLAGLGYRAMDAGDFPGAARVLRDALGLWRGAAFADLPAGVQLSVEARRLEEGRLCALDQRIEADLRLGRHRELLSELTVLVSRYRTHENLHAQFMIALYRSGRRGEALDVYQRLRATLVKEMGLEPSARLHRLQHSLLVSNPAAGAPGPSGAAGPSGVSVPAQNSGRLVPVE